MATRLTEKAHLWDFFGRTNFSNSINKVCRQVNSLTLMSSGPEGDSDPTMLPEMDTSILDFHNKAGTDQLDK